MRRCCRPDQEPPEVAPTVNPRAALGYGSYWNSSNCSIRFGIVKLKVTKCDILQDRVFASIMTIIMLR